MESNLDERDSYAAITSEAEAIAFAKRWVIPKFDLYKRLALVWWLALPSFHSEFTTFDFLSALEFNEIRHIHKQETRPFQQLQYVISNKMVLEYILKEAQTRRISLAGYGIYLGQPLPDLEYLLYVLQDLNNDFDQNLLGFRDSNFLVDFSLCVFPRDKRQSLWKFFSKNEWFYILRKGMNKLNKEKHHVQAAKNADKAFAEAIGSLSSHLQNAFHVISAGCAPSPQE